MRNKVKKAAVLISILAFFVTSSAYADTSFWQQAKAVFSNNQHKHPNRTEIVFWHSFGGSLGASLRKIVAEFNDAQNTYYVVAVNKSNYENSLTSAATAFRSHTQPNILLSYEIGAAMMIHSGGAIIPLYKLLNMTGVKINTHDFWPAVGGYYSVDNKLAGFPFNSSSPVLFYNKNVLEKAGIKTPPRTWQQMDTFAKRLQGVGQSCIFTTGYPSWILLEEFSAWNNLPYASENNGFNSLSPKLLFNNKTVVDFLTQLYHWAQEGIFMYGGRLGSSDSLFTSGKCAMTMQSSSMIADFSKVKSFKTGVAPIPFWKTNTNTHPQNTIIGGGALWTFALPKDTPNKAKIYKGVALFYQFLSKASIQAEWAKATGYIPATKSAYNLLKQEGFYQKNPYAEVALQELNNLPPKPYTKGIRLGNFPLIRQVNDAMLEQIFSGDQSAKNALQDGVESGNRLIMQFYQQNR